jgi:glycosyltransferase involved in cell wall biosynthesis
MFHLIEPQLGRVSGGLRYNHAVIDAAGSVQRHELPGAWPQPTHDDVLGLQRLLAQLDRPVLLDGLIGCALDSPVQSPVPIVQLVHALADTPAAQQRERQCLQAADAVVATSRYAAAELYRRHGLEVTVAPPGVQPRPLATGGNGGHFICVGGVEPNKNQLFLADVLAQLYASGLGEWHCTIAGPLNDPDYATRLRQSLAQLPKACTQITGELDEQALAALYDSADLLLLPSRAETFGLVVREATAAGIPSLVSAGTGAEEALDAGRALELEHTAWVEALRRWLTDQQHRQQLCAEAQAARQHLTYGWRATAETLLDVLTTVDSVR